MTSSIKIRDVTLRDGLQLTKEYLSTDEKVQLIRELLALGVDELEIGSMARPDLVPSMADTLDVVRQMTPQELKRCWIWVATPKHVARAIEAGARNFQYCLSVSESHNKANIGRSVEASLAALPEAVELAIEAGGKIQLCLATSLTCPFEGRTPIERVVEIVSDTRTNGTCDVVVCDTIGQATPDHVSELVGKVKEVAGNRSVVFHGHDTWGLGVANAVAAITAGATTLDSALGGLGGCPFAPGASGNTATEDVIYAFRPQWTTPKKFRKIVQLSSSLMKRLNEQNASRASSGAKASPGSFEWSLNADGS